MSDLQMPKVLEFIQRRTLNKGRIETTLYMFLLDLTNFHDVAARFMRGEIKVLEARIGTTIKHPADKFDKKVAKAEAAKKLKKVKLTIYSIASDGVKTSIYVQHENESKLQIVGDHKGIRIYV